MFRSFICSTLRSLVMEPKHFHFVAVPKVFFSRDHRPLDFDYQAKYSKHEIFQNDVIYPFKTCFVTFGVYFLSPGFCRDSCWEWSEYISQIYEQAWIYTYGYQAWKYTHQYILEVKHEYVLTNLYKKPAQSKASIFSPSRISANFSSNVNWKFYRMFCLQTCFEFVKFYFYFSFFAGKVLVSRWDPVENDRLVFVHCGLVISVWIQ